MILSFWGKRPIFRGYVPVSFREGKCSTFFSRCVSVKDEGISIAIFFGLVTSFGDQSNSLYLDFDETQDSQMR